MMALVPRLPACLETKAILVHVLYVLYNVIAHTMLTDKKGAHMASSTLTIRIDEDLKREASAVADYYGLDLSSVTRAFYKQMANTRRIPLTFAPEEPNEESLGAIAEGEAFLASGRKGRFSNGHDLVEAAMA